MVGRPGGPSVVLDGVVVATGVLDRMTRGCLIGGVARVAKRMDTEYCTPSDDHANERCPVTHRSAFIVLFIIEDEHTLGVGELRT